MKIIGLTGGIACGKSTAAAILREFGAVHIDADAITHELQQPGGALYEGFVRHFGPRVLQADGSLDRPAIGQLVFADTADPAERRWLDAFTHPVILRAVKDRLERARASRPPAVLLDVPLLFEAGWDRLADETWLLALPHEIQVQRLVARNGYSREEAEARIAAQMPLDEKRRRATVVIDNSGTEEDLRAALCRLWRDRIDAT